MRNESHLSGDSLKWSPGGWDVGMEVAPKASVGRGPRSGRKFLGLPSHLSGDSLKWSPALRICRFSLKWSDHLSENLL